MVGVVHGKGACMAVGMDGGGTGGMHSRWVCMVGGVFMGVCMAGVHMWQETWPPRRAVRTLLECILVNFALKYTQCVVLEQLMSIRRQIKGEMISYLVTFPPPLRF